MLSEGSYVGQWAIKLPVQVIKSRGLARQRISPLKLRLEAVYLTIYFPHSETVYHD